MVATTALLVGSAVASVASGVIAYEQGKSQQEISKQQAKLAIAKGNIKRFQQAQESEKIRKYVTAEAGKGGGSLSGSYLYNLNQSMTNAMLDASLTTYNAKLESDTYIQEGRNYRAQGTASLLGSTASAGTSLYKSGIFKSEEIKNV